MFQFPFENEYETKFEQASTLPNASMKTALIVSVLMSFGLATIPLIHSPVIHIVCIIGLAHLTCVFLLVIFSRNCATVSNGSMLVLFSSFKFTGIFLGTICYSLVAYGMGVTNDWKDIKGLVIGFVSFFLTVFVSFGIYICASWRNQNQVRRIQIPLETARNPEVSQASHSNVSHASHMSDDFQGPQVSQLSQISQLSQEQEQIPHIV